MTVEHARVGRRWLALREPADATARARGLVEHLSRHPPTAGGWVIHDLGCGTGAMGRWLAPLLPGLQHWVVHDRDADLLAVAVEDRPSAAADGSTVTVEARRSDVTRLSPGDLADASLITASALLDMLTERELARIVTACAGAGCPVLLTLTVVGRVGLTPADPLDRRIARAFNAHQRRATERGRLLGPGAAAFAAEEFRRRGTEVLAEDSPWQLDASHTDLLAMWFPGWVSAACEQEPELAAKAAPVTRLRLAQLASGELAATVGHADLLVLPVNAGQWLSNRGERA